MFCIYGTAKPEEVLNREKRYSLKQQKSAKNNCGRGGGRPDNWVTILQHLPTQGNIDFRQDIQDYVVIEWRTAKTFFCRKRANKGPEMEFF